MAKKKLLVCLGQSNGEPIGDENEWLILHPGLFYVAAPNNPSGSYNDNFVMPGNFPGFSTLNLMGKAGKESRYLVFYNPYVTGYRRYPGMGLVTVGSTPTNINTEQFWNALAGQTFTITRASTGEVRTVNLKLGAQQIQVSSAFSSAPVDGEQFTYGLVAIAAGTTSTVPLQLTWPGVSGNPGKLTGVNIKCLTGPNVGLERTILSVDGAGVVTLSSTWTANNLGDTFELKPQGLTSSEWHKWGYFLPWCPYEGSGLVGKENPYPPGFNYPGGISAMRTFNPGPAGGGISGRLAAWHHGAGFQISQLNGDDLRIVSVAAGGVTLAYNEFAFSNPVSTGWWDPQQQCGFSPSTPNGLFKRLMDVLDVAKIQAEADGDTLEIEAVVMSQGEGDASAETPANAYEDNLISFMERVRQEITDRGFWTRPSDEIRWIQPKITTDGWAYSQMVRQAVQNVANVDKFMRTFETNGIPKGDVAHYSGIGQTQIENLVVAALVDLRKQSRHT